MATGDQEDFSKRIKSTLPTGWFGDITPDSWPVIHALIQGPAYVLAFVFSLIVYAKAQTRIRTATDGWLDIISQDYLGNALPRKMGEADEAFRTRILINIFRERVTRESVRKIIFDITGRNPLIFEPSRPADTGGYGTNSLGYGLAGGYGSTLLPYQAFITAYRPTGTGIPLIAGYGVSTGGYGVPSRAAYASLGDVMGQVADADIYAAIDSVMPAGTIAWTQITT